jgi:hypothetical protein
MGARVGGQATAMQRTWPSRCWGAAVEQDGRRMASQAAY